MLSSMKCFDITDWEQLTNVVTEIVHELRAHSVRGATVLALEGDLGTGKTATVQLLARLLGVSESVVSPTFTIMKTYHTRDQQWQKLYHLDVYRFASPLELTPLRWSELVTQKNSLICVEWSNKIAAELPTDRVNLSFELTPAGQRTVRVEGLW